jgi:outer membrane receptor protein involved in Fe transport
MRRVSGILLLAILMAADCLGLGAAAASADLKSRFDLPAESMDRALRDFALQANCNVSFEPSLVAGLQAPAVKGEYSRGEVLSILLTGTALKAVMVDSNTIQVVERSAQREFDKKAADNRDDLEEIIVTGTHIRGILNSTNPVMVIDREQIERSGYASTQDLFRSLPQNFSSGEASEDGLLTGNPGAFQNADYASGVDLRGLGATSTLVLLNGHRLAPSATGTFVDVSQVPLAAIERVEILTDGSSAIYGSDAVGGVVNIILRKDYQGADTALRYGATSNGGRDEVLATQTEGATWSTGSVVGTLQFQRQDRLAAGARDFADALPYPNDLLPETKSYGMTLDGRQDLTDSLELYGDVLLSKREFTSASSQAYDCCGIDAVLTRGDSRTIDVTPGLHYKISSQWSVELIGLYGEQRSSGFSTEGFPGAITDVAYVNRFTAKSVDLVVNGKLGATPAGVVGMAVGASYRTEDLNTVSEFDPGMAYPTGDSRHVAAEFAELHLPIVSEANRVPLVEALELSLAARQDRYSDFGATTNPHVGVRWAPQRDVALRASYGKSFRAPTVYEESLESPAHQIIYTYQVASPSGAGLVPILESNGSTQLKPERARTLNFGVEYKPAEIPDWQMALDYYDIHFENRIIVPPSPFNVLQQPQIYGSLITPLASDAAAQAIVNSAVAAGVPFYDYYGTGVTGVRYWFDDRQQNAALVRQSGIDFTSKFSREFGAHTLTSQVNVSFVDKIDTQFSPTSTYVNQVNTFGSPPRWRGRFDLGWGGSGWSVNGALNAVGGYINTTAPGLPSIASWRTMDLNATIDPAAYFQSTGWQGLSLSLIVLNVLNRDPPYAVNGTSVYPVNYDPANANPLGRLVALALRKKW